MSTPQEYWDACLIKTWRQDAKVLDTIRMFESITQMRFYDCQLLRTPLIGFPWKLRVRVFVASHLNKISERLWDQAPEKDVLLLRKLASSSYTTTKQDVAVDYELGVARKQHKNDRKRLSVQNAAYKDRNESTDWNVTKGSVRTRMAR